MLKKKQKKLEAAGWKVGTVKEFLNLTDEEAILIEIKHQLMKKINDVRKNNKITQSALALLIKSSQSRVAKMESNDRGVTLDLICKTLLALGLSKKEIARAIEKG